MSEKEYPRKHTYPLLREGGRQKPRIPIRIINITTGKSEVTNALIDTGSDSCVFPSYITSSIGYELKEEDKRKFGIKGISGIEVESYVHGYKIELLDRDKRKTLASIDTIAYTVNTNNLTPLLGTNRFLMFFKITIDYNVGEITLEW